MRSQVLKFTQAILSRFGMTLTWATDRDRLVGLLGALWPIDAGVPLIRFGDQADGSYLMPDDLDDLDACLSPGVGNSCDFELACAARGMRVFMVDGGLTTPPSNDPRLSFRQAWLTAHKTDGGISIREWIELEELASTSELILQMDIEGAEWELISVWDEIDFGRFRVIVIEFHQFHYLTQQNFFDLVSPSLYRLLDSHAVVHLHPNNCCGEIDHRGLRIPRVLEVTLLRRDRVRGSSPVDYVVHPLDRDNTPNQSLVLDRQWLGVM